MKKIIVFLVTTVTIIPYSAAYVLSYLVQYERSGGYVDAR